MDKSRIIYLLQMHRTGQLSEADRTEFFGILASYDQEAFLLETMQEELIGMEGDEKYNPTDWKFLVERILKVDKVNKQLTADWNSEVDNSSSLPVHQVHFLKTSWFRYAAAILLLVGTGAYLWFQSSRQQTLVSDSKPLPMEIPPGKEGAVLTLADGSQVVLDSLGNGIIASQNGAEVVLKDGQLAYDPTDKAESEMAYNTMATPKGRQFQVVLPDGTRVWLNAASSIRYPTVFTGKERRVEIMGEAYFEVAQKVKQPFFVQLNNQAEIQVLGTSFNINAYENEHSVNTTLIEGSIKITSSLNIEHTTSNIILKPGQQAQLLVGQRARQGIKLLESADIDKVMAWKNGTFNFEGAGLEEVMRQLERWYDLKVVYEGAIPKIQFFGEISRNENLSSLLKALEESKVHCRMEEGRRLIVLQ